MVAQWLRNKTADIGAVHIIIPEQMYVIDIYRKGYKCTHCADDELTNTFKAPAPVSVIKKSMATTGTIAYIM